MFTNRSNPGSLIIGAALIGFGLLALAGRDGGDVVVIMPEIVLTQRLQNDPGDIVSNIVSSQYGPEKIGRSSIVRISQSLGDRAQRFATGVGGGELLI